MFIEDNKSQFDIYEFINFVKADWFDCLFLYGTQDGSKEKLSLYFLYGKCKSLSFIHCIFNDTT